MIFPIVFPWQYVYMRRNAFQMFLARVTCSLLNVLQTQLLNIFTMPRQTDSKRRKVFQTLYVRIMCSLTSDLLGTKLLLPFKLSFHFCLHWFPELIKECHKLFCILMNRILGRIVLHGIEEGQSNIGFKLLRIPVVVTIQFLLNCSQIHWAFYYVKVVRDAQLNRIHRLFERKSTPMLQQLPKNDFAV
uniref:Uncharacterized protein n=1 Tax=Opuntia streptacantha TaxID=393608 RepID=A0A7C8YGG6_OPUST